MRPKLAPLFSGSVYASADVVEVATTNKLLSFKGEDFFLALKKQDKMVTFQDGSTKEEPVLNVEFSMKRFGSYLGQFPLLEFVPSAQIFLTNPHILISSPSAWKKAGGFIECEKVEIRAKDLILSLKGSCTISARDFHPEEGCFVLGISGEKGILVGLQNWASLLPRAIKETDKCGDRACIPVDVRTRNWFLDDSLLLDGGAVREEALEHILSGLENGVYSPE
jgi:hypothetical protein